MEYFTVHHPVLIPNLEDPVSMAFLWGVVATWWMGLLAGIVFNIANHAGRLPRLQDKIIARWVGKSLVVIWVASMVVLGMVYLALSHAADGKADFEYRRRLVSVATTHAFSYGASAVAMALLAIWVVRARYREAGRMKDNSYSR